MPARGGFEGVGEGMGCYIAVRNKQPKPEKKRGRNEKRKRERKEANKDKEGRWKGTFSNPARQLDRQNTICFIRMTEFTLFLS